MSADSFVPSPICRTPADRERFIDMSRRMLPTQNVLLPAMFVLLLPGIVMSYPLPAAALALTSGTVQAALQRVAGRFRRPELVFAASMAVCLIGFTAAIVLAGREHDGDLIFLIWPVVTAYSRFPARPAHVFTALTATVMTAVPLIFHPAAALARPGAVIVPDVALVAVAVFATAIRESDDKHRREAIVDELTGLLNRNALWTRIGELQAQSRLTGAGIGLIVADLDRFKTVNDRHGHAKGDEVLREVAVRLAEPLRAYDSLYRIGGEELAVLVPGASGAELLELSERLCEAVRSRSVAGLRVTISAGAARSPGGRELAWDDLFRRADGALYRAKAAGRDRVAVAPEP